MHLADRPDGADLDQFDHAAEIVAGVHLRPHLRSDRTTSLEVLILHQSRLAHGVGERLLAIDMLICPHRPDGTEGVMMISGADHDAINLGIVDDLAPVGAKPGVRKLFLCLLERARIDVAKGDDVLATDAAGVRRARRRR
jgi:hypothetical protein